MEKSSNTDNKKNTGFTLIELLVVMAVLAILALIAIPRFASVQETAEESKDHANATIIYRATLAHFSSEGDLDGFDINNYIDQNIEYTGGELDETTGEITPVTVNGETYPGP